MYPGHDVSDSTSRQKVLQAKLAKLQDKVEGNIVPRAHNIYRERKVSNSCISLYKHTLSSSIHIWLHVSIKISTFDTLDAFLISDDRVIER